MKAIRKTAESIRNTRRSTRVGAFVFVTALILRGAVCLSNPQEFLAADPDDYRLLAETLSRTGVYGFPVESKVVPTARRPPLYPFVLSLLVDGKSLSAVKVAWLHALLGAFTVWCVYRAARQILGETDSHRGSLFAALLVLIDPILIRQSTLIMTETLAASLAALVIWFWVRHALWKTTMGYTIALGTMLSIAFFCRPTFVVWAALLCACVTQLKPRRRRHWQRPWLRAILLASTIAIPIGMWAMRNQRALGHPVWATTHGGYTLLLGNNPLFYDYLRNGPSGQPWDATRFQLAYQHRWDEGVDPTTEEFWRRDWRAVDTNGDDRPVMKPGITEVKDDELDYRIAMATIGREPGMFVWSCLVRVARLWEPFPSSVPGRSNLSRNLAGFFYIALYLMAGIGLLRLGREVSTPLWWPGWALVITLTLVHAVYWSNMRMRAPAIPMIAIAAAAVVCKVNASDKADVGQRGHT